LFGFDGPGSGLTAKNVGRQGDRQKHQECDEVLRPVRDEVQGFVHVEVEVDDGARERHHDREPESPACRDDEDPEQKDRAV
jgi:hypothetical protein